MNVNNAIKRLARDNCASFTGDNGCLMRPNGQSRCNFFRDDDQARQYVEDGTMRCLYFERSVLPSDTALEAKYFNVTDNVSKCARCRHDFVKSSNAAKYCDGCRDVRKREGNRDRQRKHYWNDKAKPNEIGI